MMKSPMVHTCAPAKGRAHSSFQAVLAPLSPCCSPFPRSLSKISLFLRNRTKQREHARARARCVCVKKRRRAPLYEYQALSYLFRFHHLRHSRSHPPLFSLCERPSLAFANIPRFPSSWPPPPKTLVTADKPLRGRLSVWRASPKTKASPSAALPSVIGLCGAGELARYCHPVIRF